MKCLDNPFFFIHFFDLMAIWEAMKIHTAMVPITNGSGIFRLFFLNFFLFNYVDEFFKFFNCFLFISLKQEIKISTVRRGEFKPVSSLCRKRLMKLFFVIFGHNQFCKDVWGRLFESHWKELLKITFLKTFWINCSWRQDSKKLGIKIGSKAPITLAISNPRSRPSTG